MPLPITNYLCKSIFDTEGDSLFVFKTWAAFPLFIFAIIRLSRCNINSNLLHPLLILRHPFPILGWQYGVDGLRCQRNIMNIVVLSPRGLEAVAVNHSLVLLLA